MERKPPQERKTPIEIEQDHYELVRVKAGPGGMTLQHKVDSRYRGFDLVGEDAIEQLRDICDAWLDANEE